MLKSLKIENFRCFPSFEMQQLGRLNLIVGTNNSGKTSILEAIHLLTAQSNLEVLQVLKDTMTVRGEYINDDNGGHELEVRHLFRDHIIHENSKLSIKSHPNPLHEITLYITHIGTDKKISYADLINPKFAGETDFLPDLRGFELNVERFGLPDQNLKLPLSSDDGLDFEFIGWTRRDLRSTIAKTQFVGFASLTIEKTIELFDQVVLTSEEDLVIEALQILEPSVKRIAAKGSERSRQNSSRGNLVVRLANNEIKPIGSMGDGIWRILGLILAVVNAKNGVLLVDEIDTGLHFTVMSDMWKMLWETAKRLNVQIFATTHSNDCWKSLADIANAENPSEDGITIHRVEKGKPHSIVFTEDEIAIAAEEGIEVR
jgi:ABC-type branched-subunit amino acid transport system ATPase component